MEAVTYVLLIIAPPSPSDVLYYMQNSPMESGNLNIANQPNPSLKPVTTDDNGALKINDNSGKKGIEPAEEPKLAYIPVADMEGVLVPAVPVTFENEDADDEGDEEGEERQADKIGEEVPEENEGREPPKRKKKVLRRYSRALKAVFSKTFSAKRFRKGKNKLLNLKREPTQRSYCNATTSSSRTSRSTSISPVSSSSLRKRSVSPFRSNPNKLHNQRDDIVKDPRQGQGSGQVSNVCLCMFVLSLLVLILWGKTCSILCTSAWFFLVPRWSSRHNVTSNKGI